MNETGSCDVTTRLPRTRRDDSSHTSQRQGRAADVSRCPVRHSHSETPVGASACTAPQKQNRLCKNGPIYIFYSVRRRNSAYTHTMQYSQRNQGRPIRTNVIFSLSLEWGTCSRTFHEHTGKAVRFRTGQRRVAHIAEG